MYLYTDWAATQWLTKTRFSAICGAIDRVMDVIAWKNIFCYRQCL